MREKTTLTVEGVDPVLPIKAAAALAGDVHHCTLRRCAERGELQLIRISPRRVGIRKSEFTIWRWRW
jgi:hypothetical protein